MFHVGQTVYCVEANGTRLVRNGSYRIGGIRGNLVLVQGSWCRASRFSATRPAPLADPYTIANFYNCCGAGIVYFGASTAITKDRLDATLRNNTSRFGFLTLLSILNQGQERACGKLLQDNGWQRVGISSSKSGKAYPLYTYIYIVSEANQGNIIEQARKF